ncbi:type II toxin-antitoxin system RelE/ParE family toxin [Marivirga arenosa]|uniref:Type II toxin-antitoxin system RelE/ParE family toxin n=1 Tax=Marivirga arenosa TaxID=3059076 RepID=A0AA51ZVK0_9BACT|nr:type II toxin-antitoxin system RelE/ParE family toxin [Marivirga sp. BKB1-2]WNB17547.1 type II toxin-antitoxin system RelE/ParE family toxin [Marivirga sp. BKB1-2]
MLINYKTKKLQKQLTDPKQLNKHYGQLARKINQRLKMLKAADNLAVMKTLPGGCHELKENYKGCLAVDVSGNYRLIFKPDHDPIPENKSGGLDWESVTIIEVQEITDYH